MTHLSSYDNIFETKTWCFGGNMKVLLGHLYTLWTSEGIDSLTDEMIVCDIIVGFCIFN